MRTMTALVVFRVFESKGLVTAARQYARCSGESVVAKLTQLNPQEVKIEGPRCQVT